MEQWNIREVEDRLNYNKNIECQCYFSSNDLVVKYKYNNTYGVMRFPIEHLYNKSSKDVYIYIIDRII